MSIKLTKDNFASEVLSAQGPVLVDFWAEWCGPCRMLTPVLEKLEEKYAETIKLGKVNVDEEPELAAQYGIASIPTLIFFKGGKAVDHSVGFRSEADLDAMLQKLF